MDDLEMIKKCAEKMGIKTWSESGAIYQTSGDGLGVKYDPLHDDAQAMALVKELRLNIGHLSRGWIKVFTAPSENGIYEAEGDDLNRAIVECVSKLV